MIQELKIRNFLSFKEEVAFSFEATKDTTFEDYQVVEVAQGVRLLRFAVIFGANASGKSNLIEVLHFLHSFWFDIKKDVSEKTGVIPFKLDREMPEQASGFSMKFFVDGVKYWYQLELDENSVISEKLFFYNTTQPILLFERGLEQGISTISFNSLAVKVSSTAKEEISIKCLPNMSFFAARNQVNVALPKIDDARDWMRRKIMDTIDPKVSLFNYAKKRIIKDELLKRTLLEFIHEADFNINDIKTTEEKQDIPQDFLEFLLKNNDISVEEKERFKAEITIQMKTDFEHVVFNERGKEHYFLPENVESEGTIRVTGIQTAIYAAQERQAILVIDEIESSLHPDLILFVLKKFLEQKGNEAQLVITTHYDPLLDEVDELFRKDSVWFTEKNESGATELYSLVEFKGLNRIASKQKAYRQGRFGAIPKINL